MNGSDEQRPIKTIAITVAVIVLAALMIVGVKSCVDSRNNSYRYSGYSSRRAYAATTPKPAKKTDSAGQGFTPRKSGDSGDSYGASDYDDPEWFYEDNYDDFESYEDAELYWEEHADD